MRSSSGLCGRPASTIDRTDADTLTLLTVPVGGQPDYNFNGSLPG
jgi:hypothetical protein